LHKLSLNKYIYYFEQRLNVISQVSKKWPWISVSGGKQAPKKYVNILPYDVIMNESWRKLFVWTRSTPLNQSAAQQSAREETLPVPSTEIWISGTQWGRKGNPSRYKTLRAITHSDPRRRKLSINKILHDILLLALLFTSEEHKGTYVLMNTGAAVRLHGFRPRGPAGTRGAGDARARAYLNAFAAKRQPATVKPDPRYRCRELACLPPPRLAAAATRQNMTEQRRGTLERTQSVHPREDHPPPHRSGCCSRR